MDDTDWWPTTYLQFIYKDGRYVLQQKWMRHTALGTDADTVEEEWRDVPTADSTQP